MVGPPPPPLGPSIARASNPQDLTREPFGFLERGRALHGNAFVIREGAPLFSRARDCAAVIAVFGAEHHRAVLGNGEAFGMPESAATTLGLPENLVNLNRGLHSLGPERHGAHKRQVMALLGADCVQAHHDRVWTALETSTAGWTPERTMGLTAGMRELVLEASSRVMFGERSAETSPLARLLESYFQLRREASSPGNPAGKAAHEVLVAAGNSLDETLRAYVREWRRDPGSPGEGVLGGLAKLRLPSGPLLTEDEVVGHANVLFVSSNEPVAVALTWILLILTQLPGLRAELRDECRHTLEGGTPPSAARLLRQPLLEHTVAETLRLLPPNAFMVRVTTRPRILNGLRLPHPCEIVICPFLAHRDPVAFTRPTDFWPGRWAGSSPQPFDYLPFGAGVHACAGRTLGLYLIKTALVFLLSRFDLVLAGDQEIDWRVHILFMPRTDPVVAVRRLGASPERAAGKLAGPVSELLTLS